MAVVWPASTHTPLPIISVCPSPTPLPTVVPLTTLMAHAYNVPPGFSQQTPTAIVIRSMAASRNQAIPVSPAELAWLFRMESALPSLLTAKITRMLENVWSAIVASH
jgi:hypothetical protein